LDKSTANQGRVSSKRKEETLEEGGLKEPYLTAKRRAKHEVYTAKKLFPKQVLVIFMKKKSKKNHVLKLARKMKSENQDIVGEKCIRNDQGKIACDDEGH